MTPEQILLLMRNGVAAATAGHQIIADAIEFAQLAKQNGEMSDEQYDEIVNEAVPVDAAWDKRQAEIRARQANG